MTHVRTLFRNALVALLVDANVSGGNVLAARPVGANEDDLPETRVYALSEDAERQGECQPWRRILTVQIQTRFAATADTTDTVADTHADAIEQAIETDTTISGTAFEILPPQTTITFSEPGYGVGEVTLTYQAVIEGLPS